MAGRRHDRALLDALDAMAPEAFTGEVWRVTLHGRPPLMGSMAAGRWSPAGEFEALYTSLSRAGALAEIGYRLGLEPVWPSRAQHRIHRIAARTTRTLRLADLAALAPLGVDAARFGGLDYAATQAVAAAARFLGMDSLIVPSARAPGQNLVVFLDVMQAEGALAVQHSEDVDWDAWREAQRARP